MPARLTAGGPVAGEEGAGRTGVPRNLAVVDEPAGVQPQPPRRRTDRLFGEAAQPTAPRPERARTEAPRSLRWAAVVVGIEAVAAGVGALWLLYLVLTSTAVSMSNAIAEVVVAAGAAAVLTALAVGLWRVASWARGPVVVLQLLLAALAYTATFQSGQPAIGLPVLALVAAELYLLATPASRLAYFDR
jgi:hypothetical protein